ncbi:MAG: DUF2878 domain-containing protein [Acidobacteriota bacterium]
MRPSANPWIGRLQALVVFVVLQVGWFSCVLGAAWGLAWLGPSVVAVLVILHLVYSRSWRRDLALMAGLCVVGVIFETLLVRSGWVEYRGSVAEGWAPPWIVALWVHFGTMRHALLRVLYGRPALATVAGAVGGPVAYAGGAALGAAVLTPPEWRGLLVIGAAWATVMPVASALSWRGTSFASAALEARGKPAGPEHRSPGPKDLESSVPENPKENL